MPVDMRRMSREDRGSAALDDSTPHGTHLGKTPFVLQAHDHAHLNLIERVGGVAPMGVPRRLLGATPHIRGGKRLAAAHPRIVTFHVVIVFDAEPFGSLGRVRAR